MHRLRDLILSIVSCSQLSGVITGKGFACGAWLLPSDRIEQFIVYTTGKQGRQSAAEVSTMKKALSMEGGVTL